MGLRWLRHHWRAAPPTGSFIGQSGNERMGTARRAVNSPEGLGPLVHGDRVEQTLSIASEMIAP